MGMTPADYLSQLQALLPQGPAWARDPDAVLTRLLSALSEEFARIDARAGQVIDEADPRNTTELLVDWERVAGLSALSPLDGSLLSTDQRRANLVSRITERGGQSPAYFIAMAARMGFVITITEFREWTVGDSVDAPLYGFDWNFAWRVNAPAVTAQEWSVDSTVDDPFAIWFEGLLLERALLDDKPAHTILLINYQ
jgi:uncharacterized protein YmfQ (DUF2313 family)